MAGYMYILHCSNGSYYTGSTKYLLSRYAQHESGRGAKHTQRYPPIRLLYYEKYFGVDTAYYRECQIKGWSRKKKEALIHGKLDKLRKLSECQNRSHCEFIKLKTLYATDPDMVDPNELDKWEERFEE